MIAPRAFLLSLCLCVCVCVCMRIDSAGTVGIFQAYPELWRSMVKGVRRLDGAASCRFSVKLDKREVTVTAESPQDADRWMVALEKAATAVRFEELRGRAPVCLEGGFRWPTTCC